MGTQANPNSAKELQGGHPDILHCCWDWPECPCIVHADYAGPTKKMFSIVIDAHSKWLEVHGFGNSIQLMQTIYNGLPVLLVTDNSSVFTSAEFQEFI